MQEDERLTVEQAARIAKRSPNTIYRANASGDLPYRLAFGMQTGRVIMRSALERWMDGLPPEEEVLAHG